MRYTPIIKSNCVDSTRLFVEKMGPALRDEERGLRGDEEEVPTDSTLLLSSLTLKGTVAGQVGGVAAVEVDAVQKDEPLPPTPAPVPSASLASAFEFMFCAAALQVSYLVWGVMQELIMNTKFNPTPKTPSGKFPSATFCVFSNRFLAIIVAAIVCRCIHGTVSSAAPLMQFTPCALSNTISSYSQYQALSFVSFSLQTLFKATKVIPVMVMGTVLKGTTYSVVEYVEALAITVGVAVFSLSKGGTHSNDTTTQLSGFLLLCSYVAADSFTSQWQSRIYRDYGKIDHYHMMYGVNVSSIIITVFAMIVSGEIPTVCEFLYYNPLALWYNVLTAITSTTGQMSVNKFSSRPFFAPTFLTHISPQNPPFSYTKSVPFSIQSENMGQSYSQLS